MAANRNRYADKKLEVYKDGTTYSTLVVKMATDYTNEATIKQLFKLDYVHKVNDGQFIGGVLTSGSENLKFHDTSNKNVDGTANSKGDAAAHQRLSHLRVRAADGNTYALFNDAGLNTKPDCAFFAYPNTTTPFLLWGGGNSRVCVQYNPARFVNTDVRKIMLYRGNTLIDEDSSFGGQVQNTTEEPKIGTFTAQLVAGELIKVVAETTNAEGTIQEVEVNVGVGAQLELVYKWDYYYTADENTIFLPNKQPDDRVNVYIFNEDYNRLATITTITTQTGIKAYKDIRMNKATTANELSRGWYSSGENLNGAKKYYYYNGANFTRYITIGGATPSQTTISPIITRGNIGIQIGGSALNQTITITQMRYYDGINGNAVGNAITINKTISSGYVGQVIDTGIKVTKQADFAAFIISGGSNINTPIVRFESTDFEI